MFCRSGSHGDVIIHRALIDAINAANGEGFQFPALNEPMDGTCIDTEHPGNFLSSIDLFPGHVWRDHAQPFLCGAVYSLSLNVTPIENNISFCMSQVVTRTFT